MKKHINAIINLTLFYIISYGFYYTTQNIFSNLTLSLCLISAIYALLHFTRIPAPPKEIVAQILGKDLREVAENESAATMRSVGHRGVSLDAPENSLEAFKLCLEHGMRFVEFDVQFTKDGVPVVFHDVALERIADLADKVRDLNYDALMEIDIAKKHAYGHKYKNIRIPTLEETVKQLLNDGQVMFIDLKCYTYKIVDVIIKLFEDFPELHSRAIVTSFSPISIYQIRKRNSKIVSCLTWRPNILQQLSSPLNYICPGKNLKQFWAKILDNIYIWALENFIHYLIGISVILIHKDAISDVMVRDWHQRNVRVIVWTVNSPIEKQYFARILRIPYMTDTITAENSTHSLPNS